MGGNYQDTLAEDDIKGIKYIADQAGVGQNDAWKEFLNDPNKTPVTGGSSKPSIFIRANGRFVDIYVSYSSSLTYCICSKDSCK